LIAPFRHASLRLWNEHPDSLRQIRPNYSITDEAAAADDDDVTYVPVPVIISTVDCWHSPDSLFRLGVCFFIRFACLSVFSFVVFFSVKS